LNELFSMFDEVAAEFGVEKIETIGDAFMCVVFEEEPDAVLNFALGVLDGLRKLNELRALRLGQESMPNANSAIVSEGATSTEDNQLPLSRTSTNSSSADHIQIRSGIFTGPCFGGILGSDVPRFHIFGDAHDGSVLLEQNGRPGTSMVSKLTYENSKLRYIFKHRPEIEVELNHTRVDVYQLLGRMVEYDTRPVPNSYSEGSDYDEDNYEMEESTTM
jgi:adenylate cyclase